MFSDKEETTPQLLIWITTEPSSRVPSTLLDSVVSISWHYITNEFFEGGESKLASAPLACLTDSLNRGDTITSYFIMHTTRLRITVVILIAITYTIETIVDCL